MSKRWLVLAAIANSLFYACTAKHQERPEEPEQPVKLQPVDDEYQATIASVLSSTLAIPQQDDTKLQYVRPALPVPKVVKSDAAIPTELAPFYSIPKADDQVFKAGNISYSEKLRAAADRVQIGKVKPTPALEKAIENAKTLLFEGGENAKPTEAYLKYQKYEKDYTEALSGLSKASSVAEKNTFQQKIQTLDREWKLFGKKAEISQALSVLATVDVNTTKELLASWKKAIEAESKPDAAEVWSALSDQAGWVTISFSPPTKRGSALTASTRKEKVDGSVLIPGLKLISLKICRVAVRHPALEHPFLRSRLWRLNDKGEKIVLSEGDPKQTQADEVVPWKVSQLTLAKGVELQFSDQSGWQALVDALEANDEVVFAGFVLKGRGSQATYSSPKHISLASPCVIAVMIDRLPKIPNPDPQIEW